MNIYSSFQNFIPVKLWLFFHNFTTFFSYFLDFVLIKFELFSWMHDFNSENCIFFIFSFNFFWKIATVFHEMFTYSYNFMILFSYNCEFLIITTIWFFFFFLFWWFILSHIKQLEAHKKYIFLPKVIYYFSGVVITF